MDFYAGHHLEIMNAIIKLIFLGRLRPCLEYTRGGRRFEDGTWFSMKRAGRSCHSSQPTTLYHTQCSWHGDEAHIDRSRLFLKHCVFVNARASRKLKKVSKKMRHPRSLIIEQLIEVSGFGENASFTLGYINFDLTIGPTRAATCFHVIDICTSYLMLGRPWIHKH